MRASSPGNIEYSSPQESLEQGEEAQHRFDLIVNGQKIGAAEINYYSKPLPLYQLTDLYVDHEYKGKGHASKLLKQVETFLKKRRKPGILVDAIIEGDPAEGMYAKRGWKSVPHVPYLFVFNWPADVSLDVLRGYGARQTDIRERQGYVDEE